MSGTIMPYVKMQWFTDAGLIASGYQLFTYEAGTTTKLDTYSDAALTTPNTNPIVLDSAGRADVFLDAFSYKFVLAPPTDTDPPTSPVWTVDNVTAVPQLVTSLDVAGVAGENLVAGNWVYLSQGDGARTAGRWYKTDADLWYASSGAGALGHVLTATAIAGGAITLRVSGRVTGLAGLTAGDDEYLSQTAGAITNSAPTSNQRIVGMADGTTSVVFSPHAMTRFASDLYGGVVSREAQNLAGEKNFSVQPMFQAGGLATAKSYISGVLNTQVSSTGVGTAGGAETTLFTYTLPGGTLAAHTTGTNVPALRVTWRVTFAADADVKLMKLYFGATAINVVNLAVNLAGNHGKFEGIIARVDGTHQLMFASGSVTLGTAAAGAAYVNGSGGSPGEDLTGDVVIKVTGQNTSDADDNAIVGYFFMVEMVG
jgi:hypothetical protein